MALNGDSISGCIFYNRYGDNVMEGEGMKVIFDEFTDTWLFGIICGVILINCLWFIHGCVFTMKGGGLPQW